MSPKKTCEWPISTGRGPTPIMREMPIETTARRHLSPTKMAALSKCWPGCREIGILYTWWDLPWNTLWRFLRKAAPLPRTQQSCCTTPKRTESRGPGRFVHNSEEGEPLRRPSADAW